MNEKLNTIKKKFKLWLLDNFSLSHGQTLIILSLVLLLSFILRVYRLDIESIWYDEAFSLSIANENIFKLIERVAADDNPPLYYIILHFWIKIFGYGEYSLRFISVIFGVLSVYVLYRVGRLIFNEEIGILSAFILSISLFNIQYSQEARFYTLLTLVVLISNYYFIKILNERNWKHVAGYIISTTAICYTHVFGLFYIIFQNIYYLLIFRKNIKFWITIQGAILLLFLPWLIIFINQIIYVINTGGKTGGGYIIWIPQPSFTIIIETFKLFASNYTNLYLFIILVIIGMVAYKYKMPSDVNDKIFLLLWLFVPIVLSVVISLIALPIYFPKYVIASIPAFILLVSKSIFNFRKNIIIFTILIILILSTVPSLERYYNVYEKVQWRDVVNYIEQNRGNNDNDFILVYPASDLPFKYYYKNDSNFKTIKVDEAKNFTKYDGIWLIVAHPWSPEMKNGSILIENTLAKTHALQYSINFAGNPTKLSRWHRKSNMTNMTISMDINVEDPEDEIADGVLIEIRDKKNASNWWVHIKDWKIPANDTYNVHYGILTDVNKNIRIDIPAVMFQSYFGYMPARYEFTIMSNANGGSHINFSIDNIKIWDNNYTYFEENFDSESSLKRFNLRVEGEKNKGLKMQHNISIRNGRLNIESFNENYRISIFIPPNYLWSENDHRSY